MGRRAIALATAAMGLCPAAWALELPAPVLSEPAPSADKGLQLELGGGVGFAPDYEGSDHYEAVPLWNLRASDLWGPTTYVQVLGPSLRSNLLPSRNWRLGVAGRFISKRGDVDDHQVDELQNVDPSVMLGGMVGYDFIVKPNQRAGFEAEVVQDVANGNGLLGTLRFTSAYSPAGAWHYGFVAETNYASSDYMEAYFTVDQGDANRSGLRQYDADAGLKDFGFSFSVAYDVTQGLSLSGLASYKRLVGDASDSPITKQGSDNQWFGGLLLSYRF
jgi:outer membrane scaffolding protein for murein synthesis (MipA/OmpV family)